MKEKVTKLAVFNQFFKTNKKANKKIQPWPMFWKLALHKVCCKLASVYNQALEMKITSFDPS